VLQTVLAAAFGFFAALFLALLAAPAVARRISDLTWRQAERVLPQTMEEIAAERDAMRGTQAMEVRRLEMKHEALSERHSTERARIQGLEDAIATLSTDGESLRNERAALETAQEALQTEFAESQNTASELQAEKAELTVRLAAAQSDIMALTQQLRRLGADHERLQAEAAQNAVRIEAGRSDLVGAKARVAALEAENRAVKSESKRIDSERRHDQKRHQSLELKLERSIRALADAEDRLERREAELKRLRDMRSGVSVARQAAPQAVPSRPLISTAVVAPVSEIAVKANAIRKSLSEAQSASPAARERLKLEIMDIAAMAVAEATRAPDAPPRLRAVLAEKPDPDSALDAAIRRRLKD
jgi:chromosome segregation ATPase